MQIRDENAPPLNIILFGTAGAGKSSIINMLSNGTAGAKISADTMGCTFENQMFPVALGQPPRVYHIWDTVGLSEGESGKVPNMQAIADAYRMLKGLEGGIGLLVFVLRASRMKDSALHNWRLFHEILCQKKVPIVVAVTGTELEEESMDDWWIRNKHEFEDRNMHPNGFACVVATKGRKKKNGTYPYQEEYNESRNKLAGLIAGTCLRRPWSYDGQNWFKEIVETTYETKWCRKTKEHKETHKVADEGVRSLYQGCGLTPAEAKELGKIFEEIDHLSNSPDGNSD